MKTTYAVRTLHNRLDLLEAKVRDLKTDDYVDKFDKDKIDSLVEKIELEIQELQDAIGILNRHFQTS